MVGGQFVSALLKKAVVLVSGGLDSATCLAIARSEGYQCYALSFNYGQRSASELTAAEKLAKFFNVAAHQVIPLGIGQLGGSALTDHSVDVPVNGVVADQIPITYVPARNTVFLSYALAWAEVLGADAIFIGVNALDYSGYPDCRPEFISAFERMANLATKASVEGHPIRIRTPLISLTKAQIISTGITLGVDYALTISCYQANAAGQACGRCDSCRLRHRGFKDAGVEDPTVYFSAPL
ncbi:MAG: 7-cyano-7-deazaguanine synthase QueC [Pseudohongiella sp.]|nr:7-cyano-7-deazaguanine synthase QueC [Pseudohongiella sp.]